MQLITAIQTLALAGLFPSRAFIPAFLIALTLRMSGDSASGLVDDAPSWFTHGATISILGLLSLFECLAVKDPDIRFVMDTFDSWLKAAMTLLTTFGILNTHDVELVGAVAGHTESTVFDLFMLGLGLITSVLVFFASMLRASALSLLGEWDADDSLGLQSLLLWVEDGWLVVAALLLVAYPFVILFVSAIAYVGLWLLQKRYEHMEECSKVKCASCSKSVYPCAIACPNCDQRLANPCGIGFCGQSLPTPALDTGTQHLKLIEHRRCPKCASRVVGRLPQILCDQCHRKVFESPSAIEEYLAYVDDRQRKVYLHCLWLGLIPLAGVVGAVLYYRLQLVAPFRRHLPIGYSLAARWATRLLCLLLLTGQALWPFGGILLLAMAWLNHSVYRRLFVLSLAYQPVANGSLSTADVQVSSQSKSDTLAVPGGTD